MKQLMLSKLFACPPGTFNKRLWLFLAFFLVGLSLLPQTAEAACPGALGTSTPVVYHDCFELKDVDGGTIVHTLPAGSAVGNFLILVVALDGTGGTITPPPGWLVVDEGTNTASGSNDITLGVYSYFIPAGTVPTNVTYTVPARAIYSWMMRFSNTDGIGEIAVDADGSYAGTTAVLPEVNAGVANSLILRVIAVDNATGAATVDPATIMTAHTNITQDWTNAAGTADVFGAAAFRVQAGTGLTGTGTFTAKPNAEEWRGVTLTLRPALRGPSQCVGSNAVASGGTITYRGCLQNFTSLDAATSLILTAPNGVAGDYLLAVLATDGDVPLMATPAGWNRVNVGPTDLLQASLGIFSSSDSDGTGAATTFNWTGGNQAFGYIMRFSGTTGVGEFLASTGLTANAPTPAVTTAVANSVVLRIGGFDNSASALTPIGAHPAQIIATYNNITQGRSGFDVNGAQSSAAWLNVPAANTTSVLANFFSAPAVADNARGVTLTLRPTLADAPATCTDGNSVASGGVIAYGGCQQVSLGVAAASITIPRPTTSAAGDFLLAVVATDDNRTVTGTEWTPLNLDTEDQTDLDAASVRVLGRFATASEPANYTFDFGAAEEAFGYIMRFTGTQGVETSELVANLSGSVIAPNAITPAVNAGLADSIIVRIGAFDHHDVVQNPGIVINAHNNITQGFSSTADTAVSSGAAWIRQAGTGTSGTAFFTNSPTIKATGETEESRRITLALRPNTLGLPVCTGTNTGPTGVGVLYQGCMQATNIAGAGTNMVITTPPSTANGNYLLAVVTVDGNQTVPTPAGWNRVNTGQTNANAATLAIFSRFATGSEPANHTFALGANVDAFGYIMRFTGTDGLGELAVLNDVSGSNLSTPDLTTRVANSMVLRIGAFDAGAINLAPTAIVSGYNNITQGRSRGTGNNVSSSASWLSVPAANTSVGALQFTGAPLTPASEEGRRVTLTLRPSLLGAAECTGANTIHPSATIRYQGCMQTALDVAAESITVTTPPSTANGDYLLAVVTTDGNRTITGSGWTELNSATDDQTNANAASIRVLYRFATGSEPGSHQFTWTTQGNSEAFAYIMRFTGTQGVHASEFVANLTGDVLAPNATTPQVITALNESLVVRLGVFDEGDVVQSPGIVINDYNNVTQNRSSASANSVTSAAAWTYLATAGTSVQTAFTNVPSPANAPGSDTEESRRITLALRPNRGFRIAHAGSALACALNVITIEAYNANAVDTGYVGNITLSTPANGYWTKVGGDANGTLLGGNGDGTATYTFVPADNGTIQLVYYSGSVGLVDFNIVDAGGYRELVSQDPALNLTACLGMPGYFSFTHAGTGAVCGINAVTFNALTPQGVADTAYLGIMEVTASVPGNWSAPNDLDNDFSNGTADDGIATYDFETGENGQVVLHFTPTGGAATVTFSVEDTIDPTRVNLPFSSFSPSLVLEDCEYHITNDTVGNACYADDVTIVLKTTSGAAINGYVGSVSLDTDSITTDKGTWSLLPAGGDGDITETTPQDGFVTYTFDPADNGEVTLRFLQTDEGTVNFSVIGGSIPIDTNDALVIGGCAFRIDTDLNGTMCAAETVTITAVDDNGVTIPDFTGTITLNTDTDQGAWAQGGAAGTLVQGGGDGTATYTFAVADAGIADLGFLHPALGAVDINVELGIYEDDNLFDDPLTIVACNSNPFLFAQSCVQDDFDTTIALPPAGTNRLALVTVHREGVIGGTTPAANSATFGVTNMGSPLVETYIDSVADDVHTQIFGLLDAALPDGSAPSYTVSATGIDNTSICVLIYQNIEQNAPFIVNTMEMNTAGNTIETMIGRVVQVITADDAGYMSPAGVTSMDVLLVGGGGGGGGDQFGAGGGGAGGVLWYPGRTVTGSNNYPIDIGGGGSAGSASDATGPNFGFGGDGGNTTILSLALTASGGGGGQPGNRPSAVGKGRDGGSGGGGGSRATVNNTQTGGIANQSDRPADGTPADGYGNNGASGNTASGTANNHLGGGGGGAGAAGVVGITGAGGTARGGNGGIGLNVSGVVGPNTFNFGTGVGVDGLFGGGGGGGKRQNGTGGVGGTNAGFGGAGGGGNAGTAAGNAATANSGGGGGGSGGAADAAGGVGGSGVALLRYMDPATLSGDALIVSAVSARITALTRIWESPADSDLTVLSPTRNFSGNDGTLTFGVSSGLVSNPGSVTITETHDVVNGTSERRAQVLAGFRPAARVLDHFRITHSGIGGTCAPNAVMISAVDQFGDVIEDYDEEVELEAGTAGTWSQGTASGMLDDSGLDNGTATYTFDPADEGTAELGYFRSSAADVDINVEDVDDAIVESEYFDTQLEIEPCRYRITHDGFGSICAADAVTIAITTSDGELMEFYTGTVQLSTLLSPGPGNGDGAWTETNGFGVLDDAILTDGAADYTFHANDQGDVVLNYSQHIANTVNFNVTGTGIVAPPNPVDDANMVIGSCFFQISYVGDDMTDVCSLQGVVITAVDGNDNPLPDFAGTITLATSTSTGDWSVSVAENAINNFGSGGATYEFDPDDDGEVILYLAHGATAAAVDIDVSSGSFQEDPTEDPPLEVLGCTFRISVPADPANTCVATPVTLSVYDSNDMLAEDYAGTVSLSTTTGHGTWVDAPRVVDNNPGNGTGSYTFIQADAGTVDLMFHDDAIEIVNIIATANNGGIIVDTMFDEELIVDACRPTAEYACYPTTTGTINLRSSTDTLGSRAVLVYVNSASTTPITSATFDGDVLTDSLRTEIANFGVGNIIDVYAWLDDDLPANAGSYTASFVGGGAGAAMCIVALEGVAQEMPMEDTPPGDGQLNGSNAQAPTENMITPLTTLENNAIVLSVVAGETSGTYASSLDEPLWATGVSDATGSDWAGNYDWQPNESPITVEENPSGTPARQAHVVLALSPSVLGDAAPTDYVPVRLYRTLSGNLNYRAIGNTWRNSLLSTCVMKDPMLGESSTATLSLPAASTIKAAYLYWAGSGGYGIAPPVVDTQVSFGVLGGPLDNIPADNTFLITRPFEQPMEFFANYADVTGLISNSTSTIYEFTDLTVDESGVPFGSSDTCVGGWSLVVVYENLSENLNVINLFHGFQPFWHSAFTLVPRNFRMAVPGSDPSNLTIPNGQITHVTFEGDNFNGTPTGCSNDLALGSPGGCNSEPLRNMNDITEVFQLQNDPLNPASFADLNNPFNIKVVGVPPLTGNSRQYNNTVSYPLYDANLDFDISQGNQGYFGATNSYGTDIDTYFLKGADPGDILHDFGVLQAEQITTRYAAGQDLVLLLGEFISVTNSPIADLEIFVSSSDQFKVGTLGESQYEYVVKNNGDGTADGGFADGDVIVTGNMPIGVTINSWNGAGWTCPLQTGIAFTCVYDIAASYPGAELGIGEELPTLNVLVDIAAGGPVFPLEDNEVTTVARLSHVSDYGNCPVTPVGQQPNPNPATGGCNPVSPQFDNVNDLNKYLIDIDSLTEKLPATNNNVHHDERVVKGLRTDLGIIKSVVGTLEANQTAHYALTVTNHGPDATTNAGSMTVVDTLPPGLRSASAVGVDADGWDCTTAVSAPWTITCLRTTPLANGASSVININTPAITAPALEGASVINTATVASGPYNFDTVSSNNFSTITTQVAGPLAAATERFLMSVSQDGTQINATGPSYTMGDLFVYDPVSETSQMFLQASTIPPGEIAGLGNVDAFHVLPNGWIVMSTASMGTTVDGVAFGTGDLVLYDPILQTARVVFSAATEFDAPADIDSLHVIYNNSYDEDDWVIAFSTAGPVTINSVTYQNNDIVFYSMVSDTVTLVVDGATDDMFGNGSTAGDIGALYIRHNYSNPNVTTDRYVISTSDASASVAIGGEVQNFQRGEVVEVDFSPDSPLPPTPDPATSPLICNGQADCIGDPAVNFTSGSYLDGLHMVETGYFGHFAISSLGGDTCNQTAITISKHAGIGHTIDEEYLGSIIVSHGTARR